MLKLLEVTSLEFLPVASLRSRCDKSSILQWGTRAFLHGLFVKIYSATPQNRARVQNLSVFFNRATESSSARKQILVTLCPKTEVWSCLVASLEQTATGWYLLTYPQKRMWGKPESVGSVIIPRRPRLHRVRFVYFPKRNSARRHSLVWKHTELIMSDVSIFLISSSAI